MERAEFTLYQQPLSEDEIGNRRAVLLTAQVALLGEVSTAVRGITLGWTSQKILLRAVFEGEVQDDDRESMDCVATEILASFPNHEVDFECIRDDAPESLGPHFLMAWVFVRKERK